MLLRIVFLPVFQFLQEQRLHSLSEQPVQVLNHPRVKKYLLIFKLNFLYSSLWPLPLLSLHTTEQHLGPASLFPAPTKHVSLGTGHQQNLAISPCFASFSTDGLVEALHIPCHIHLQNFQLLFNHMQFAWWDNRLCRFWINMKRSVSLKFSMLHKQETKPTMVLTILYSRQETRLSFNSNWNFCPRGPITNRSTLCILKFLEEVCIK